MPDFNPDAEFLDRDPPHWAAQGLTYFIVLLVILTTIAVVAVHVPETVSGRFTLVPERGVDPVRALREGVLSRVAVAEGDAVAARSPLFVIRSSPLGDRAADRRTIETQRAADSTRLTILSSQLQTRRRANQGEIRRLQSRREYLTHLIASKTRRLELARELADSAAVGARSGAVGRVEAARMEFDAASIAEEIQSAEDDRDDADAAIARIHQDSAASELEFEQNRRNLIESIETARIRIAALGQDLVNLSDSGMVILSPCRGTVLRLGVNSPGAVVKEGETLAEVACSGGRLQAELLVPQDGVPLVRPGQDVKLRYDAFPFQRYGVRFGQVRWVGPSGLTQQDNRGFRALIDLRDSAILIRGAPRPLQPGMDGLADIVVGRRSLLSYAFEPIRALRESARTAPP